MEPGPGEGSVAVYKVIELVEIDYRVVGRGGGGGGGGGGGSGDASASAPTHVPQRSAYSKLLIAFLYLVAPKGAVLFI